MEVEHDTLGTRNSEMDGVQTRAVRPVDPALLVGLFEVVAEVKPGAEPNEYETLLEHIVEQAQPDIDQEYRTQSTQQPRHAQRYRRTLAPTIFAPRCERC